MTSNTYTETVEMNGSTEMSNSSIKVCKTQNPFSDKHKHTSDGEEDDGWSILSTTSSNELSINENQGLLSSSTKPFTNSEDGNPSSSTSDDDDEDDTRSICSSDCSSLCTEEQKLDHADRCKHLESKIQTLEVEMAECWSEKVNLFDDKKTLLEEKNNVAKEKHVLLKEANTLFKEKKMLVVEKAYLLKTVEALRKENKTAFAKYNAGILRFVRGYNGSVDSMQHTIDERDTLLAEKQRLLEVAQALAAQKIKDVVHSAREIEYLRGSHSADLIMMRKTIDDNQVILAEKQQLLEAAGAIAEEKSQDAEKSQTETQRLRDQEHTTFTLMKDTLTTLKNEHAQELRDTKAWCNEVQNELALAQEERNDLREELAEVQDDRDDIEAERDALDLELDEMADLMGEKEELEEELEGAKGDRNILRDAVKKLMMELNSLVEELEEVKGDRNNVQGELKVVKVEVEEVQGNHNKLQGELNDLMIKHDITEEKLEEAMVAGASLEEEVNEYINKQVGLDDGMKKLEVLYHIFPAVKKYSGDEFLQSFMNLDEEKTGEIDIEKLKVYLCSLMVEAEKEL